VKFWLLIFFLTPEGEFIDKREVSYQNADKCYKAMKHVRRPKGTRIHTMCVSNDHYTGLKQDPGVPYD
jgi:hypothetical protein